MLLSLQVQNFRSFRNQIDFSMEAGAKLRKKNHSNTFFHKNNRYLKSAVLFGGNANGKTNLMMALRLLRSLVLNPTNSDSQPLVTDTFGNNSENTSFDICFIKYDITFNYIIEYNEREIVFEQLIADNTTILKRSYQDFIVIPEQLNSLKQNIRKNQFLIFYAQNNNVQKVSQAYSWFVENLIFVNTENVTPFGMEIFKNLLDENFKNRYIEFMRAADFNITDVEVLPRKISAPNFNFTIENDRLENVSNEMISQTLYEVYSTHKSNENGNFKIDFANESTGTQAFMVIALFILINNENSGKVLLIDEFNRSFHFELATALLDLINNEHQKNQFILTTHELSLLDSGLRSDQIWFAEKNQDGETELFSLFDFDDPKLTRSDFGYKKRYLEGRFGAKQIINKTSLLSSLGDK
ncbi:AAA family ATPase [Leuconostoc suionicum]|uniref:AAA family ATPase n=1 Tax=Leuconostoc suionicum TaxID=1511761 RepID=UPI0028D4B8CD|nr:AAA family ATPase [Leuconostoc suionicum]